MQEGGEWWRGVSRENGVIGWGIEWMIEMVIVLLIVVGQGSGHYREYQQGNGGYRVIYSGARLLCQKDATIDPVGDIERIVDMGVLTKWFPSKVAPR